MQEMVRLEMTTLALARVLLAKREEPGKTQIEKKRFAIVGWSNDVSYRESACLHSLCNSTQPGLLSLRFVQAVVWQTDHANDNQRQKGPTVEGHVFSFAKRGDKFGQRAIAIGKEKYKARWKTKFSSKLTADVESR
jgi:hypothetical protein